jgi:hypothetical protein
MNTALWLTDPPGEKIVYTWLPWSNEIIVIKIEESLPFDVKIKLQGISHRVIDIYLDNEMLHSLVPFKLFISAWNKNNCVILNLIRIIISI